MPWHEPAYLRPENCSLILQEKGQMTDQFDTSSKPSSSRNVQLYATLVRISAKVKHGIFKSMSI